MGGRETSKEIIFILRFRSWLLTSNFATIARKWKTNYSKMKQLLFSRWPHQPIRRVYRDYDTVCVVLTKTLATYAANENRWNLVVHSERIKHTSPLIRIKSSFKTVNRLASPTPITITNTSMYDQMNVDITFKHLPKNAFHGAYSVNSNSWFNWAMKNFLIGSSESVGHWFG